ncbi:ORF126 HELICASE-2 [Cydia pomonella granulovirus]|uniref:ORF126 HELICASE-2 n=2 Tax=Cydia pomonella granulosis virus TaxID=28289 RepID=Q91ES9_GVCPM|nr:ORF126 HELICASE-2 [Cydia pomonella granulovirus]AAK70786.1 ORF126 HELICASE-2 [Cydia pomonella granulovirus]AIU36773.1 ORF106 helicase [Cydia pomonella granulovirus]AIU37052.1 ORF126 helicase-2 [Cydia pomonella granulovirus]AIU37194.1 ORF126 helicase-2 [Cydia pomonella granulovirus]AIU37333.1 ORF126 helicase [Cydia pomonella granulovirus]
METDSFCIAAAEKRPINQSVIKGNNSGGDDAVKRVRRIERVDAPTKLNREQQLMFDRVANARRFEPLFVSGSAGTGKSALLVALRNHWRERGKIVYVGAYTHLASRNIDGRTCHSLFGFDFDLNLTDKDVGVPNYIILDEISMIPDKMLDGIDSRMRQNTRNPHTPFGGVNVIVFGDLYQLPPVDKNNYKKREKVLPPYEADVWTEFKIYELGENMRQTEQEYIHNLNLLRLGDFSCLPYFNTLVMDFAPEIEEKVAHTSLVSTHDEANTINNECYNFVVNEAETTLKCTTKLVPWSYKVNVFNAQQERLIFKQELQVCPGTRVMVTHTTQHFCNGDTGIIEYITDMGVYIRREHDNSLQILGPITLHFSSSRGYIKAVTGIPLNYGWAVTIHKAQGMTIKNLIVYPKCLFAPGQAYVALSRCTHSKGLKLSCRIPDEGVKDMSFITEVYNSMEKWC